MTRSKPRNRSYGYALLRQIQQCALAVKQAFEVDMMPLGNILWRSHHDYLIGLAAYQCNFVTVR